MSKPTHPWRMPQPFCSSLDIFEKTYPLMVYNSLTRRKERFIPIKSNLVTWYQCGPTVYAESHMGHARTYVSLDILRRIMKYYLGFNIIVCQNITDIDDKIIIRSSEQNVLFQDLALKFENEFVEDMINLGVQQPDITTRVSEYVSEIILYIQVLIDKNLAYISSGSVYFDTKNFEMCGYTYGKLQHEQIGNTDLLNEGEGSLSYNEEKKNSSDFVLWKKTKSHENGMIEPYWESPWGNGRPGWHIECSVMSHSAMKTYNDGFLDVHAGGIDLKFPHHENEIAQSEGYTGHNQWTNYWFHTGHLNIKGAKMSKSLKNFTTIKEVLKTYTSRQIRFFFLTHKYNEPMDYDTNSMTQAVDIEKRVSEFFYTIKSLLRNKFNKEYIRNEEIGLMDDFERAKVCVRNAILDDFDTPKVVELLLDLIKSCNVYIHLKGQAISIVTSIATYVDYISSIFGLGNYLQNNVNIAQHDASKEAILTPVLDALAEFRQIVRTAAISNDRCKILNAADEMRDIILPSLGIRLEDVGKGGSTESIWKFVDLDALQKEKKLEVTLTAIKAVRREELSRRELEKKELSKIIPSQFFRERQELYSIFDSEGIPTHNKDGQPLSKSCLKKLKKEMNSHIEIHKSYIDNVNDDI